MIKPNPFTPKSGLEPKVFINREKEIKFFNNRIRESKQGDINHYIINGIWGSGKTSLLRYFKLLAQEQKCTASYFLARELPENISDIEISIHIIQSVIRNIPHDLSKKNSRLLKSINSFGIQVLGSGFNISFEVDKNKIIDSQIFLIDSLLNIWNDIKRHTDLLIILIDDIQNYFKVQRLFTTLKNALSDKAIIDESKILFILSSTIDGWKPFIKMNHPIGRFFIPRMELQNFDRENTIKLIDNILEDTGINFTVSVKDKIFQYTDGHLFQIHALGRALYDNHKNGKVTDNEWKIGFKEALFYLGNAVYDGIVANISDNEIKIINGLKLFEINKISDINRKIPIKGINVYLRRLIEKGILKSFNRGEYVIQDKMLSEYLQRNNKNNK
ncbi:MAG: ATP-binding protein [Bacteroidia bacterium]|nr:ATP-binding protein [Bacteroidia bacterium]